jgi:uncharacterized protein with HEPN domain
VIPDADTDRRRLEHMIEALDSIRALCTKRSDFDGNELLRSHVVLKLQVVGEAANSLRPITRTAHPDVPWPQLIGMRHRIVHEYASINLEIVWDIVQHEVSPLRLQLDAVLIAVEHELESESN